MGFQLFDEHTVDQARLIFDSADGTTPQATPFAGVHGMRWDGGMITTTAADPHDVEFDVYDGATSLVIGTVQVAAGAGYGAVPAADPMVALLPAGADGLICKSGSWVRARLVVALAEGEVLHIYLQGGQF